MGYDDRDYYRDDGRHRPRLAMPQTAVVNLILVNAALFLICWFTGEGAEASESPLTGYLNLPEDLVYRPWECWRLLTYGFLHAHIWHLIFNMYGLFLFGRDVEAKYGKWEFLRFYLVTLVFGGLAYLGVQYGVHLASGNPLNPLATVVGASGATIGVTILFCLNFPRRELYLMGVLPIQSWVLGATFVAIDVLRAVSSAFGADGTVAFQVHLAGAALAALYFYSNWSFGRFSPGSGLKMRRWFQRKPKLRVHSAADEAAWSRRESTGDKVVGDGGADDQTEDRNDLARRADDVLRKLHESGEASLTATERRLLEEYSRRMRQKRQ